MVTTINPTVAFRQITLDCQRDERSLQLVYRDGGGGDSSTSKAGARLQGVASGRERKRRSRSRWSRWCLPTRKRSRRYIPATWPWLVEWSRPSLFMLAGWQRSPKAWRAPHHHSPWMLLTLCDARETYTSSAVLWIGVASVSCLHLSIQQIRTL